MYVCVYVCVCVCLGWTTSWLGQLMSASAWMQVARLSGFKWESAIRALHKAVHRAYQTSPHAVSVTVKYLYHVTRNMPESRCVVVAKIGTWLRKHAYWQRGSYSSQILPPDLAVQGINGARNDDFQCIETIRASSCQDDNSCPCIQ